MTPRPAKTKPAVEKPAAPPRIVEEVATIGPDSLPPPGTFASFRRKPGTIRATFIHEGDYAIETQEGTVTASGPFWLAIDHLGCPYPISVATFRAVWEAA